MRSKFQIKAGHHVSNESQNHLEESHTSRVSNDTQTFTVEVRYLYLHFMSAMFLRLFFTCDILINCHIKAARNTKFDMSQNG